MFPLGMILSHHKEKVIRFTEKHLIGLIVVLVLLMVAIPLQGYYYYTWTTNAQAIYSQYNTFIIPYTLLITILCFYFFSTKDTYRKTLIKLSTLSFFVFFIHVAIIYTFWRVLEPFFIQSQNYFLGTAFFSLFFFFFVTGMSFLLADLFHRIPKLSKLTG
jgi:uncharacterized membrane protein